MYNQTNFDNLSKLEFEYIVKELLKKLDIVVKTEEGEEEKIIRAFCNNPLVGGEYIVLIKKINKPINRKMIENDIRKIKDENITKLIIIISNTFAGNVKDYNYGGRLEIIDAKTLFNLFNKYEISIEESLKEFKNIIIEREKDEDEGNLTKYDVDCSFEDEEIKKIRRCIRENKRGNEIENLELKIELVKYYGQKFDKVRSNNKKRIIMSDINDVYQEILKNPYVQNLELLPKEDSEIFENILNMLELSINMRKGEFSNILANYVNINEKLSSTSLKNKEVEIYNILNIIKILEISNEYKKIEEFKSVVEQILENELSEKEIALRETNYEIRKIEKEIEDFKSAINKEADEKLGIIHYKNIELFNKAIDKQKEDIELLKEEIKNPGTIKTFNLFSKKRNEKELLEFVDKLENNIKKTNFYKDKIQDTYVSGQNKFLLEYKERVLCEIYSIILNCKVEKEINKNNFNSSVRLICWDLIDRIIDELTEIKPIRYKEINKINIQTIEYPKEIIDIVTKTSSDVNNYLCELDSLSKNLEKQIMYIRELIENLNKHYDKSQVYLYEFKEIGKRNKVSSKNFRKVDMYEFLKTIDKNTVNSEIQKVKTLLSMYRFN